ncbi:hypothetical protein SAMN05216296_1309 [Pseudomonas pohangensis]|jgi:hypothetical protein|uniref:Uncharacterized protein n=1 Tax=Pseudomonas pohangensis TaxID=364197 RepID=A0A1H2F449_9PSED|nr:hypothetical protein [Pseudomonas pohangensis]SDU02166.1 hypothetical protein SAMN05216296_1309 [Pseudomonas pohangensis]
MMMLALAATLILTIYLRQRSQLGLVIIPLAALLMPLAILFSAFIYPGDPELQEWWLMAVGVGLFFGGLIASFGYFITPMLGNRLP